MKLTLMIIYVRVIVPGSPITVLVRALGYGTNAEINNFR